MSMMKGMLDEEIRREFEKLNEMVPGSDEYKATVDGLTKLMDRAIEIEKFDIEVDEKVESRENETELKLKQMQEDKKDRLIKNIMMGTKDAAIIIITVWGTVASINFEREGTITTSAGRKHLNKLLSWFK